MGKTVAAGFNSTEAQSSTGTVGYRGKELTAEQYAVMDWSTERYNKDFDDLGESLRNVVTIRGLRGRVYAFLRPRANDGILLGLAIPKLKENLDQLAGGNAPVAPAANEPGGALAAGGGGYAAWFAHTGECYERLAENLSEKVVGKCKNAIDLEKRPSEYDVGTLPDGKFTETYGITKEEFLKEDGVTFDKKHGTDKVSFLRERVLKRYTWEEDMLLKGIVDRVYGHSTEAPTVSKIISGVSGIACGERVDFSVLASDPEAQAHGVILDPDGEGKEAYWKTVDEKLKDARFMNEKEFSEKWKMSKEASIDEALLPIHKLYDRFIAGKVARMSIEELKDRYYLSELRGDELIGELVGDLHSIKERALLLEAYQKRLETYREDISKLRDTFGLGVVEREEVRQERMSESKRKMTELERAHPELAHVMAEVYEPYAGEHAKSEEKKKAVSAGKIEGAYNLKRRRDNPYLIYTDYRDELREEKGKVETLVAELESLKNVLEETDASSLEFEAIKDLIRKLDERKLSLTDGTRPENEKGRDAATYSQKESVKYFLSRTPREYLNEELKLGELEKLDARRKAIRENAPVAESGSATDIKKYEGELQLWEQNVAELEKTILPEIGAAKEKWARRALDVVGREIGKRKARLGLLSSDIENIENAIPYIEKQLGIEDYKRIKARQKEMDAEFPGMAPGDLVMRKLALDALAKSEEILGKEEFRRLEARRKELKENLPDGDPASREAALNEVEGIEETLGIGAYKKLEAQRKEVKSRLEKRLVTGEIGWVKRRKEELEQTCDIKVLQSHEEYGWLKTRWEELRESVRKDALKELEPLERELGVTGYADLETEERRLEDRINELRKSREIPAEIEAKRKEVKNKEDYIEALKGEVGEIEKKFGVPAYTGNDLAGRLKNLKKNIPKDPMLRKLALGGMKSSPGNKPGSVGVNLTGLEEVERYFEDARYEKARLEEKIGDLEGGLPMTPQLELEELEILEKEKERIMLAKKEWMAGHGAYAVNKWKDEHGVTAYKRLVTEARALDMERTNDNLALKVIHDRGVAVNVTLNEIGLELGHMGEKLEDGRQPDELREMLWGTGRYSDVEAYRPLGMVAKHFQKAAGENEDPVVEEYPVNMAVFTACYEQVESMLSPASIKLVETARKNIAKRSRWLRSHPSQRDREGLQKERDELEYAVLSPGYLFSLDKLEKGDTAEFGEFVKRKFGIEPAGPIKTEIVENGTTVKVSAEGLPETSLFRYNRDRGLMLEMGGEGDKPVVEKLMMRRNPKTGELSVFPEVRAEDVLRKMYATARSGKK